MAMQEPSTLQVRPALPALANGQGCQKAQPATSACLQGQPRRRAMPAHGCLLTCLLSLWHTCKSSYSHTHMIMRESASAAFRLYLFANLCPYARTWWPTMHMFQQFAMILAFACVTTKLGVFLRISNMLLM